MATRKMYEKLTYRCPNSVVFVQPRGLPNKSTKSQRRPTYSSLNHLNAIDGGHLSAVISIASSSIDALQAASPLDTASTSAAAASSVTAATAAVARGGGRALLGGMLAGAAAGAAVDFALYPLDTIKTRLQTGSRWPPPHLASAAGGGTAAAAWAREVAGLYAGVTGSLAAHVPAAAVFFAVYETSKVRPPPHPPARSRFERGGRAPGAISKSQEGMLLR